MMRVHPSENADAAIHYFDDNLFSGDYFLQGGKVLSYWAGNGARILGVYGKRVVRKTFADLVNNINPQTGKRLTQRNRANRRPGFDVTFNATKCVSVAYALTKDPKILAAHHAGMDAAMKAIERDMQVRDHLGGTTTGKDTGNIMYARFDHFHSRPVETELKGKTVLAAEPHLHSHNYMVHATYVEDEQRWKALDGFRLKFNGPYYEAIYHAVLSNHIRNAGYSIERTAERYAIIGISKPVRDKFSSRKREIDELARIKSIVDPKEKSELAARTRKGKAAGLPEQDLPELWRSRLTKDELAGIQKAKGEGPGTAPMISAKEAVDAALDHWLERHAAAPEKRVLAHALSMGYGRLLPEDVERELAGRSDVLRESVGSIGYVTTKAMVRAENRIIEFAARGKGVLFSLNPDFMPEADFLNDGQRRAIKEILTSKDRVVLVSGKAGTGKTTTQREVRTAIEAVGKKLYAVAPSAEASRGVLRNEGFKDADTIAGLLIDKKKQNQLQGQVLLVDEAGQVGVRDMDRLFGIVQKQNARIILSGDVAQHGAVAAGAPLRDLETKARLPVVRIETIVRQKKEPYRAAVEALAKGETAKGFDRLDRMGVIKEVEDPKSRYGQIADAYINSTRQKRSALVVSPTNAERELLAGVVRQKMRKVGLIRGKDKEFDTQRNLNLSESQRQDPVNFEDGQIVKFHQNDRGFRAGKRYQVIPAGARGQVKVKSLDTGEVSSLPLDRVERFQVYRKTQTSIGQGDLIRITGNGKTQEQTKLFNGQRFEVRGFTKEGDVRLHTGKTLPRDFADFRHAYVGTSHGTQGKTAKDVIVAQSALSFPASNDKQFYVSVSRGAETIQIFTDNKADLKSAVRRSGDQISAGQVADAQKTRLLRERQRNYYQSQTQHRKQDERSPRYPKSQRHIPEAPRSPGRE